MKKITAVVILSVLTAFAHAETDLIEMAKTENRFTLELLVALNRLPKEKLNGARDSEGRSMLHVLASRSHSARALPVLLAGGDVSAVDQNGRTPLFDVISARDPYFNGIGDLMFMEMLTFKGANVNARAKDGTTPLMLAVDQGAHQKAAFLLRRGAEPEPKDVPPERAPLKVAQEKGDARMAELLTKAIEARKVVEVEKVAPKPEEVARAVWRGSSLVWYRKRRKPRGYLLLWWSMLSKCLGAQLDLHSIRILLLSATRVASEAVHMFSLIVSFTVHSQSPLSTCKWTLMELFPSL